MSSNDQIDNFSDFMNGIASDKCRNKFFGSRPIANSPEHAFFDSDVEKFLLNKFDKEIDNIDDYMPIFLERLFTRIYGIEI